MADNNEIKVGLYGGSFDPIHFGHLNLALEILEHKGLDKIFFCPAALNPLKSELGTPQQHRLEMLKLALEPLPMFEILTWEFDRGGPSYTIDTLKKFIEDYPHPYLILGEDLLSDFHQWKDWQQIQELATIVTGPRSCAEKEKTGYRVIEVSSTELRDRLSKGLYCEHLMPKNVVDYIHTHQLYSTSNYG